MKTYTVIIFILLILFVSKKKNETKISEKFKTCNGLNEENCLNSGCLWEVQENTPNEGTCISPNEIDESTDYKVDEITEAEYKAGLPGFSASGDESTDYTADEFIRLLPAINRDESIDYTVDESIDRVDESTDYTMEEAEIVDQNNINKNNFLTTDTTISCSDKNNASDCFVSNCFWDEDSDHCFDTAKDYSCSIFDKNKCHSNYCFWDKEYNYCRALKCSDNNYEKYKDFNLFNKSRNEKYYEKVYSKMVDNCKALGCIWDGFKCIENSNKLLAENDALDRLQATLERVDHLDELPLDGQVLKKVNAEPIKKAVTDTTDGALIDLGKGSTILLEGVEKKQLDGDFVVIDVL